MTGLVRVESESELRAGMWIFDRGCKVCDGRKCWVFLLQKVRDVHGRDAWRGVGCKIERPNDQCVVITPGIAQGRIFRLRDDAEPDALTVTKRREVVA